MATDSEPESGAADEKQASVKASAALPSERPKRKKSKRPRPPIPKTEAEIDSPTKQTVGMLGILGILTVVCWALARGGCNYHPPKETRVPREVTIDELARDPKNAAIELQQRWLTRDFDTALKLASGDVVQQLKADQAACNAACLGEKKALAAQVLTSAVILEANMMAATTRVTSIGLPGGPKAFLLRMERSDAIWKATMRKADDGVPLPALPPQAGHELLPPGGITLSTAGSAAPASSVAPSASAAPGSSAGAPHPHPHPVQLTPAPAASK